MSKVSFSWTKLIKSSKVAYCVPSSVASKKDIKKNMEEEHERAVFKKM